MAWSSPPSPQLTPWTLLNASSSAQGSIPAPFNQERPLPSHLFHTLSALASGIGLSVEVWPPLPPMVGLDGFAQSQREAGHKVFALIRLPGAEHIRPEAHGQPPVRDLFPVSSVRSSPVPVSAPLPCPVPLLLPSSTVPAHAVSPQASSSSGLGCLSPSTFHDGSVAVTHPLSPQPASAPGANPGITYCGLPHPWVPSPLVSTTMPVARFGPCDPVSEIQGQGPSVPTPTPTPTLPFRYPAFGWGPTYRPRLASVGPYSYDPSLP